MLTKDNEVKVLTFIGKNSEQVDIETIELPRIVSFIKMVRSLISLEPLQISFYRSSKMRNKIYQLTSQNNYDVKYFHLINSLRYYYSVADRNSLKVLDFTDISSLYLVRFLKFVKNPIKRFLFNFGLKRVLKYEKFAHLFDTVFVCSPVGRDFLIERKISTNIQILSTASI